MIIQRSNLDGRMPKSRWGTLNLGGGTLTLGGGTRPPYNLSTGNSLLLFSCLKICCSNMANGTFKLEKMYGSEIGTVGACSALEVGKKPFND